MSLLSRAFLLLACAVLLSPPASAAEALPRKILALYNRERVPGDHKDIAYTELHLFAEMPLNHLGMDLVYRDVAKPLPAPGSLKGYRGVITWFVSPDDVPKPETYCRWLERVIARGLKVVVLGEPGVFGPGYDDDTPPSAVCGRAFERLGAELGTVVKPEPGFLQVLSRDSAMVEHERKIDVREFAEVRMTRARKGANARLRIGSRVDDVFQIEPVILSRAGGVAVNPAVLYSLKLPRRTPARRRYEGPLETAEVRDEQFRWRLDPFSFFEKAFGLEGWPRPDTTTLNGRRIFYTHIDGDGFFNVSEHDGRSGSGEVFLEQFLERYPRIPFTVSLVTGYYDIPRFGTPKAVSVSRRMMALPNVEPASHGYAHPMNWGEGTVGVKIPGYRFDAEKEISGSIRYINENIVPKGKRAGLFLWTGDCLPDEAHVAAADKAGLLNLNGGDARFDKRFDSVAFVTPLSRPLGTARQIYSSNSNENTYTNLWQGPYYGFREVIETFRNTESPRRLKPVNVYMHFYSVEKIAAIKALRSVYEWSLKRPLIPIFAGEYAGLVSDFFDMRMTRLGPGRFRFEGGTRVRTVRFDGERRSPDLLRSKGVLGFNRRRGSLYVFFDESDVREVVLTVKPPAVPHVREADFLVSGWRSGPGGVRFMKRGWRKGEMVLAGIGPRRPALVRLGKKRRRTRSGKDGTLRLRFDTAEGAGPPVQVMIEWAE